MNKKIIYSAIFGFFVLIAIALATFYFFGDRLGIAVPGEKGANAVPMSIDEEFSSCFTLDYDKTSRYGSNSGDVFYKIAEIMASNNERGCSALDGDERNLCYTSYYKFATLKFISEGKDVLRRFSNFDIIKKGSDDALIFEALMNNDMQLCGGIKDVVGLSICKAITSLNPEYCENIEADKTDFCFTIKRIEGSRSKGCDDISKDTAKSLCMNSYYVASALRKGDINDCSKIEAGGPARLNCLALLSQNPKSEINAYYRENMCYEKFIGDLARSKNDVSICEKIPAKDEYNTTLYQRCISQFK